MVLCLCDAFKNEIPEASITDNLNVTRGKDKPYEWQYGMEGWSEEEMRASSLVTNILHCIAECEEGKNIRRDYQKKMVHELTRRYPVRKISLFIEKSLFCSVSSEYLKAVSTLTDLHLFSDYTNELLFATMEDALYPEHNLMRLTLQASSYNPYLFSPIPVSVVQWLAKVLQSGRFLTHVILRCICC